jgi:hypothetical protein
MIHYSAARVRANSPGSNSSDIEGSFVPNRPRL